MSAKYDKIGKGYNHTRKADPHLVQQLIQHLRPETGKLYLDIGCGTGNYTHALAQKGFQLIGIDPSKKMLTKAAELNSTIKWQLGTAEDTGLPAPSVNGIIATLTIHHWQDLGKAFQELYRVLKAGRIVIFTSTPAQMEGYWLNHYFPEMMEASIRQMPSFEQVSLAMTLAGFTDITPVPWFIPKNLEDKFLYSGKENPSLYLEASVRNGISSFTALAHQSEVNQGLTRLKRDIKSGEISEIIAQHQNTLGDYLYIIGSKPA